MKTSSAISIPPILIPTTESKENLNDLIKSQRLAAQPPSTRNSRQIEGTYSARDAPHKLSIKSLHDKAKHRKIKLKHNKALKSHISEISLPDIPHSSIPPVTDR